MERAKHQREELAGVLEVLEPVLDIVDTPVNTTVPPAWCRQRGWEAFLLSLDEDTLAASERGRFAEVLAARPSAPNDLRALAGSVSRYTRLPSLGTAQIEVPALRGVAARKRGQLAVLLGALPVLATHAARIVDVGGGRGHFACLAAELFQRPTLALDRDASLLLSGIERSTARGHEAASPGVQFVELDVGRQPLELQRRDLAIGLHACGELGDRLVVAAGAAGCDLALVSCCFQKTSASARYALSRAARGLEIRRGALGLANLAPREEGVEASLADNLRAREARLALRYLLRARGLEIGAGEEMRGVNRRRAQAGFEELAAHACALRGLPSPTPAELRSCAESAQRDGAILRRLSLPRHLLARLVELAIVRDRAATLEEQGLAVRVAQLCEERLTPRNTVLFASADPARLPPLRAG